MNRIKILGLMVVAAAALMATVGAGSALGTETALCKAQTTKSGLPICEGAHLYKSGEKVHAELEEETEFTLETGVGIVECKKSTLQFTTEQETAIPLGANVNAITFGECTRAGAAVEIFALKNGTLDMELIDLPEFTHNGTLTFTGTEVKVVVGTIFGNVECRYALGHSGILTGGATATIDLVGNWVFAGGNPLCGNEPGRAKGNYTVTSPKPLWVSM